MTATVSPRTALTYVLLSLTWGSSFLFIKVGLRGLSAPQVATGRILLGAATLVLLMILTRRSWPRSPRIWAHLAVVAMFLNVIPFALVAWAEQRVPSGVASIYNATTPIMTLIASWLLLPSQRLRPRQVAGVVMGMVGVVALVGPWRLDSDDWGTGTIPAQLALLAMTACYGFALTHLRRHLTHTGLDAVTLAAGQLAVAAVASTLLTACLGGGSPRFTLPVVGSMLVLGCLGTGAAYVWNNSLVRTLGAARTSTVTYVTPVVGVLLGVVVLGEPLHWTEPVAGVVILIGILLTNRPVGTRSARVQAPEYQI